MPTMRMQNPFEDVGRRMKIIHDLLGQAKPSVDATLLHARKISEGDGPVSAEDIRNLVALGMVLDEYSAWAETRAKEIDAWTTR